MREELKPCPHCPDGGTISIDSTDLNETWVWREKCGAETGTHPIVPEAIAAWNQRAKPVVKALEWKDQSARACSAKTAFGTYYFIHRDYYGHGGKTRYVGWECILEDEDICLHGSVSGLLDCEKPEAQSSVQADFTRRVHACLEGYDD